MASKATISMALFGLTAAGMALGIAGDPRSIEMTSRWVLAGGALLSAPLLLAAVWRRTRTLPENQGYVYVMTNPVMPGLVKIGFTRQDPKRRARELRTTGVPADFQVRFAMRVNDPEAVESRAHQVLRRSRVTGRREFFRVSIERAIRVVRAAG